MNFFNEYVRYIIVQSTRTVTAVAGVEHSVIGQLQRPHRTQSNFFDCFFRACNNGHKDGSLIVLDSRNSAEIHQLGVNNHKDNGSIIELHSCHSDNDFGKPTVRFRNGDYDEYSYCHQPALCMLVVSFVQMLFYTWDVAKLKTTDPSALLLGPIASTFVYNPHRRGETWRFLTYAFVHVGQISLVVNLIVQLLLGVPLEMVYRGRKVMAIYFSGILANSLATSVTNPSAWLAGASGGVYALIAAHVATVIINWSETKFVVYQISAFTFLTTLDVAGPSLYAHYAHYGDPIDFTTLLAGAVAGLLIGVYTLRNRYNYARSWENGLRWFCFVVYAALTGSIAVWNMLFSEYFAGGEPRL